SSVGASGGFESDGRPAVYSRALNLIEQKRIDIAPLITHRYTSFADVETALSTDIHNEDYVKGVEVLRRVGCEVEFDKRQTCCAQPAFNTGYLDEARLVARRFISIFEESKADAIVSPSGSCTAMVHHYPQLFAGDPKWLARAHAIAAKTHELSSFLVRVLKVEDVGASWQGRL